MASSCLLNIRTNFANLEIHGPSGSRLGGINSIPGKSAFLSVKDTENSAETHWTDLDGQIRKIAEGGPRFYEETNYRIMIKSLNPGQIPILITRDPNLFKDIDTYSTELMCAGPFNFKGQIGYCNLEVRVGKHILDITIEVFPVKLDYELDYALIVSEIATASRALALEYLRATYQSGSVIGDGESTNIEWIVILRNEIDILERAVRYINDHPYRALSRKTEFAALEKIRKNDSLVRKSILQNKGSGQKISVRNIGQVYRYIRASENRETLDTQENRWLKAKLRIIAAHLNDIYLNKLNEIEVLRMKSGVAPKRSMAVIEEIVGFQSRIKNILELHFLIGIRYPPITGFSSLALLSGIGYCDAYGAVNVLCQGLEVKSGKYELSVSDLHELYEKWCFIRLVQILVGLFPGKIDFKSLIKTEEEGLRVRLKRGGSSHITIKGKTRNISVYYNPEYPGLTGDQKPDIVLRFEHESWPDLIVVFDSKYRLDASERYLSRFSTVGPPIDAVNALHRYRDAIVLNSETRRNQRPVVKGVALFPLNPEESIAFFKSPLCKSLETLGIGALPFLPSNTDMVEEWIKSLISLPAEDLADPGPAFAGLEEKHRRALSSAISG